MLYLALVFLLVGLSAGALGLAGIAAAAGQIAWLLFLIGIVLLVIHLAATHQLYDEWRGREIPAPQRVPGDHRGLLD